MTWTAFAIFAMFFVILMQHTIKMTITEDISNMDDDPQGDAERQLVGANWFRGQGEIYLPIHAFSFPYLES